MLHARHPRVLLNVSGICNVEQLFAVCTNEVPDVTIHILGIYLLSANPLRRVIRRVFLVERFTVYPIGKALKNERTIQEVRDDIGRDLVVIVDQVAFRVAVFRPEDLVQVGEAPLLS